jgi:hypothetical protein
MAVSSQLCISDCVGNFERTTTDRMGAPRRVDRRRVCLCAGEFRKRALLVLEINSNKFASHVTCFESFSLRRGNSPTSANARLQICAIGSVFNRSSGSIPFFSARMTISTKSARSFGAIPLSLQNALDPSVNSGAMNQSSGITDQGLSLNWPRRILLQVLCGLASRISSLE